MARPIIQLAFRRAVGSSFAGGAPLPHSDQAALHTGSDFTIGKELHQLLDILNETAMTISAVLKYFIGMHAAATCTKYLQICKICQCRVMQLVGCDR